jgi:hypothetical protein
MKLTTVLTLIGATVAIPGSVIAGGAVHLSPWPESRKLIQINRVDRVSTNASWVRLEWTRGTLSPPASLAPGVTPVEGPATAEDLYLPASKPAAIASSSRVGPRRPEPDPGSVGKHNRPG